MLNQEVKRGSAEMLILALVEERPRHGYEIAKLIEQRSEGVLQFPFILCSIASRLAGGFKAAGLRRPRSAGDATTN